MSSLAAQFERDGFLVLPDFHPAAACRELMERGRHLSENYRLDGKGSVFQTSEQTKTSDAYFLESGERISFFFEKDAFDETGALKGDLFRSLNKIGHALHDLDPVFDRFSRSPQLKALSASLGMQDHLLIQSMLIFKHARIGGVVDVHQDSTFLYTEPDSCVGFWFALEDATIENGCLWAKPGGHRTSLRSRFVRDGKGGTRFFELDPAPLETDGMQALEVKQGTCIVLHGRLPHFSQPNTSGKSRQAYAIHTIDPTAQYPMDNWLQRDRRALKGF